MPDRNCSNDLEMWASWLVEGRLSDMALCRSSSDSLMWSANRNSCGGLVAIAVVKVWWTRGCGGAWMLDGECGRRRGKAARAMWASKHQTRLQDTTGRVQSDLQRFQVETQWQGCSGERSADGKRAAAMDGGWAMHGLALAQPQEPHNARMLPARLGGMSSLQRSLVLVDTI